MWAASLARDRGIVGDSPSVFQKRRVRRGKVEEDVRRGRRAARLKNEVSPIGARKGTRTMLEPRTRSELCELNEPHVPHVGHVHQHQRGNLPGEALAMEQIGFSSYSAGSYSKFKLIA